MIMDIVINVMEKEDMVKFVENMVEVVDMKIYLVD